MSLSKDCFAFPRLGGSVSEGACGMTLRDYFAAKALVSMHVEVWHWREDMSAFNEYAANAAQTAYAIADAMLAERSKP